MSICYVCIIVCEITHENIIYSYVIPLGSHAYQAYLYFEVCYFISWKVKELSQFNLARNPLIMYLNKYIH